MNKEEYRRALEKLDKKIAARVNSLPRPAQKTRILWAKIKKFLNFKRG